MELLRVDIKEEVSNSHTESSPLDTNVPSSSNSGSSCSGSIEEHIRSSLDATTLEEINRILVIVNSLTDLAKLYFCLKLPINICNQSSSQNVSLNPFSLSNQAEMNQAAVWIHSHLQPDAAVCLRKDEVYQEYRTYCERHGIKFLNTADFGKAMKRCFPNVKPRRLGQRGQSKYCYGGLKKKLSPDAPRLSDIGFETAGMKMTHLLAVEEAHSHILLKYLSNSVGRSFNSLEEAVSVLATINTNGFKESSPISRRTNSQVNSVTMSPMSDASLIRPQPQRTIDSSLSRASSSPAQRPDICPLTVPNFSTPPARTSRVHQLMNGSPFRPVGPLTPTLHPESGQFYSMNQHPTPNLSPHLTSRSQIHQPSFVGSPVNTQVMAQPPQNHSPILLMSHPHPQQTLVKCEALQAPNTPPQAHMPNVNGQNTNGLNNGRFRFVDPPPHPAPLPPVGAGSSPYSSSTLMRTAAPPPPSSTTVGTLEDTGMGGKRMSKRMVVNMRPEAEYKWQRLIEPTAQGPDVAAVEDDAFAPDWNASSLSPLPSHTDVEANGSQFDFPCMEQTSSDLDDIFYPSLSTCDQASDRLEVGSSPCPSPSRLAVPPYSHCVKSEPPGTPKSAERPSGRNIGSLSQRLDEQQSERHGDLSTPVPLRTPTPNMNPNSITSQ